MYENIQTNTCNRHAFGVIVRERVCVDCEKAIRGHHAV